MKNFPYFGDTTQLSWYHCDSLQFTQLSSQSQQSCERALLSHVTL